MTWVRHFPWFLAFILGSGCQPADCGVTQSCGAGAEKDSLTGGAGGASSGTGGSAGTSVASGGASAEKMGGQGGAGADNGGATGEDEEPKKPPTVVINEVLWIGVGEFIELYNLSDEPVSVEGFSVDAELPRDAAPEYRIRFPAGWTIEAQGFLVVHPVALKCTQPCLEYSFSAASDTSLVLLDQNDQELDRMFLPSREDGGPTWGGSYGRYPDGDLDERYGPAALVATPGEPNPPP